MSEPRLDHSPARLSGLVAVGCLIASVLLLILNPMSFVFAVGSAAVFLTGLRASKRFYVSLGASGLAIGIILAALAGVHPVPILLVTVLSIIAWDSGQHAITIGRQLGSAATTRSLEQYHVLFTAVATFVVAVLVYLIFYLSSSSQPFVSIVLLLVSAITIVVLVEYTGYQGS